MRKQAKQWWLEFAETRREQLEELDVLPRNVRKSSRCAFLNVSGSPAARDPQPMSNERVRNEPIGILTRAVITKNFNESAPHSGVPQARGLVVGEPMMDGSFTDGAFCVCSRTTDLSRFVDGLER